MVLLLDQNCPLTYSERAHSRSCSELFLQNILSTRTTAPSKVLLLDERLERHQPIAGGGIVHMRFYCLRLEPATPSS